MHCIFIMRARFAVPAIYPYHQLEEPKKTYRQGDFDSLCGIYAIINAYNHLNGPIPTSKLEALFNQLIAVAHNNWSLKWIISDGIYAPDLSYLMRETIVKDSDVVFYRPFYKKPNPSISELWEVMTRFLAIEEGVILYGDNFHWSVITAISPKALYLADSLGKTRVNRATIERATDLHDKLTPHELYFLSRGESHA